MLEVPISLVNLHDALVKAPGEQHKALILHDFRSSYWPEDQYLALKTNSKSIEYIPKYTEFQIVQMYLDYRYSHEKPLAFKEWRKTLR